MYMQPYINRELLQDDQINTTPTAYKFLKTRIVFWSKFYLILRNRIFYWYGTDLNIESKVIHTPTHWSKITRQNGWHRELIIVENHLSIEYLLRNSISIAILLNRYVHRLIGCLACFGRLSILFLVHFLFCCFRRRFFIHTAFGCYFNSSRLSLGFVLDHRAYFQLRHWSR